MRQAHISELNLPMHRQTEAALAQQPKAHPSAGPNRKANAAEKVLAILLAAALAGCSTVSLEPITTLAAKAPIAVMPTPIPVAASPALAVQEELIYQLKLVFDYADQLRTMQPRQLSNEVARLGSSAMPTDQLRLALVLLQSRPFVEAAAVRQNGETAQTRPSLEMLLRAHDLVQGLVSQTDSESAPLRPFARLLLARITEQKRVEDLLERQSGQLRETQRRLDQANEKLQALREIERSLTRRSTNNQPSPPVRPRAIQP